MKEKSENASSTGKKAPTKKELAAERAERLARELKANLKRRKDQGRARKEME